MKKNGLKFTSIIAFVALGLFLVSCGGGGSNDPYAKLESTIYRLSTKVEDRSAPFEATLWLDFRNKGKEDIVVNINNFRLVNAQGQENDSLRMISDKTLKTTSTYGDSVFLYATLDPNQNYTIQFYPDVDNLEYSRTFEFNSKDIEYVGLGKRTTREGMTVTVHSVRRLMDEGRRTPNNDFFLVFDITIDNTSDESFSVFTGRFNLEDSRNRRADVNMFVGGNWIGSGPGVAAGRSLRGNVAFDTSQSDKYTFLFNSNSLGEPVEITIFASDIQG